MNLKSSLRIFVIRLLTIVICAVGFAIDVYADSVIAFPKNQFSIYQECSFFLETSQQNDFTSILKNENQFTSLNQNVINFSYQKNACWIHFSLIRNHKNNLKYVLTISNPLLEKNTLFFKVNQGVWDSSSVDNKTPISNRYFSYQFPSFHFPELNEGDTLSVYLRTKSEMQVYIPIQIATVIETDFNFDGYNIMMAIYVGIMLFMFLYNLFVFISVKDKSYFFYVIYVLSIMIAQAGLSGFTVRYLIPSYPYLNQVIIVISSAFAGFGAIAFASQFLALKKHYPILDKGLLVFYASYTLAIAIYLTGNHQIAFKILDISGVLVGIYALIFSVLVSIKKYRPARFFLLAWSIFIFGLIVFVLKNYGIVADNLFTNSSLQWGSAAESLLLSFALADKINIFRKEKEFAQKEALASAYENERIVREQNVILEAKVTERTSELNESNTELTKTLSELKSAQTLLVESEKMASLGQLTAGIAHEINNPINFVTSNVNPLKRDIDMLLEMLNKIENISLLELNQNEKQNQINELKLEIDFEYLKTEIEYLLKGIKEGSSRTAEIVKGLRIFSRLDEDDLKKADINEGLDSTLTIVNNLLNSKISVVKLYGKIPLIDCYPGKLNQVFLNIISNSIHAIKSKFEDAIGGEITITTRMDDKNLFVSISDNGMGMTDETKRKLFDPFYTTKQVGEGTGLGLSIVYNTIKKHNGLIHVNSLLNKGTEFIIEIPLVQHLS